MRTLDVVRLAAVEVAVWGAHHIDTRAVHCRGRRRHAHTQYLLSASTNPQSRHWKLIFWLL